MANNKSNTNSDQEKFQKILLELLKLPENRICADCHSKGPRWASATLGVFICIKCSGIHRSMGVHISFVRSVTLDKWNAEQVKTMQEIGNAAAREIYEYNLPENYRRPNESDTYALEQFIRAKYERKEFMKDSQSAAKPRKKREVEEVPKPVTQTPQKTQVKAPAGPDLLSWGNETQTNATPDAGEFTNFQNHSSANSDPFHQFVSHQPSGTHVNVSHSKVDAEAAFFGDFSGAQSQPQQPKSSKDDIMSLFNTPVAPSNVYAPQPQLVPQQPKVGPNYNVVMPGLGMPTGQPRPPAMMGQPQGMPVYGQPSPMMGQQPMMGHPQGMMGQPQGMAPNYGGYQYNNAPVGGYGAPVPNTGMGVNTGGYVSPKYIQSMQSQPQSGLKYM